MISFCPGVPNKLESECTLFVLMLVSLRCIKQHCKLQMNNSRTAIKAFINNCEEQERQVEANINHVYYSWDERSRRIYWQNHETAVCVHNQQIIQRHWNNIPRFFFCFSLTPKNLQQDPLYLNLSRHICVVLSPPFTAYFICPDKQQRYVYPCRITDKLKIGEICTWGGSASLGLWGGATLQCSCSCLYSSSKKCKSSSNAVNNKSSNNNKSICMGTVQLYILGVRRELWMDGKVTIWDVSDPTVGRWGSVFTTRAGFKF